MEELGTALLKRLAEETTDLDVAVCVKMAGNEYAIWLPGSKSLALQ